LSEEERNLRQTLILKTTVGTTELTIKQSEVLMASVIIARSTSFVISKLTMASMEPFNILAVRFILAFLFLAILFRKKMHRCSGQIIRYGFALGITYTIVMGFEMAALRFTETSLASLIENSAFMLVPVLTLAFRGVWPVRNVVIGMMLSFGGLLVLMLGQGADFNIGCVYLLGAMAFYAFAIYQTAIYARGEEPLLVGIVQLGTMGIVSLAASFAFETFRLPVSETEWGMLFWLIFVSSVFGFTFQPVAQRKLTASRAGMFTALNPIAAMLWGYLVLAEPVTQVKLTGAVLVLAGILYPLRK
jgi:drug/metabolite transporter (DMT)-like permease